jgi:hypothetical protein
MRKLDLPMGDLVEIDGRRYEVMGRANGARRQIEASGA